MELTKDEIGVLVEWYMRKSADAIRDLGVQYGVSSESLDRLQLLIALLKEDASGTE